ncbi:MAG: tetratricopeptide repeat protein, partial [Verrucomicrobiota bacterium]
MVRRVLVLMLIAKVAFAQAPSDDGSAEGLLRNGFVSFNSGDYERSAAIFSDFMESYGSASEAQQYFERVQRMLSFSYLKLKDYDSAQDPVKVYLETFPDGEAVEELSFWQCVLSLKSNDIDTALAQIDAFIQKYPKNDNLPELRLMQLIANIGEQKYDEVLKLYPIAEPTLNGSIRYQAMTLALFAEIQSQLYDEALVRVKVFPVTADDLDQISGFHLLALDLGSRLLEEGRHRDALVSLQRAWSRNRILSRQAVRLEQLEEDLATAEKARVPDELEVLRLKDVIARVNKELSQLESMELYDTALQFRIAECFFQLKRLRESFLVIRGMLNELPDSELLIHGNYRMLLCLTQMERWEEAIESAVNFEERFPDSKLRPNVIYLMGESEMRRKDFQSAAAVFARLVSSYPDFQEVERCHFLHGYCLMMTEAHTDAVEVFDQFLSQRGQSDFKSEVTYWKAMAFHYLKEWEQSREAHGLYLDTYPDGKYRT